MINYKGWKYVEGVDPVCEFSFVYSSKRTSLGRERIPKKKNIYKKNGRFIMV